MGEVVAINEPKPEPDWATFENFWVLYPRHEAKKNCAKLWLRLSRDEQESALLALPAWRKVWQPRETRHIPLPTSWLNGARWEDEIPAEFRPRSNGNGAPQPAKPEEPSIKTAPPPEFYKLLEQLRGKRP